jgi:hypothetical protein
MEVLYASQQAQDMLRELKGTIVRPDISVPPAILALTHNYVVDQNRWRTRRKECAAKLQAFLANSFRSK